MLDFIGLLSNLFGIASFFDRRPKRIEAKLDQLLALQLERLDPGPADGPDALVRLQTDALLLLRANKLDEAGERLSEADRITPHSYSAFLRARVEQVRGQHERAVTLFGLAESRYWDEVLAGRPGVTPEAAFMEMARATEAHRGQAVVFAADPRLSLLLGNLGAALTNAGHYVEARGVLERALAIHTRDDLALTNLGYLELKVGNTTAAGRLLRLAHDWNPADLVTRVNLASALKALGQHAEARQLFEGLVRERADFAPAWIGLGEIALADGSPQEAVDLLATAVSVGGGNASVYSNRSIALGRLGRLDDALADARKAVELDPCSPAYRVNLGFALFDNRHQGPGVLVEAASAFRQALVADPEIAQAYLGLGNIARAQGNAIEARRLYERFLTIAKATGCSADVVPVIEASLGR